MLKKIKLTNFRTHKKSELGFGSGVNGIIGISSSGKTNILRALKLLAKNRPIGDGVISRFAQNKEAIIETEWSGVGKIKMVQGKDSYYQINDQKPFRKIGTSVPDAVTDALFLSDLNVLAQYDGPFLIFSSPGEISKAINDATGAGEFDTWISNINNRIKDINFNLKDSEFRIAKYRVEREKLHEVPKLESDMQHLIQIHKRHKQLKNDFETITEIYNRLLGFRKKVQLHKQIIRLHRKLNEIKKIRNEMLKFEEIIDLHDELTQKKEELKALIKQHNTKLIKEYSKVLVKNRSCPTCKSPIKQSTITRLKNEVRLP